MPKILFLTTHNLISNPRLVKEINLALAINYEVEVICFIFRNWSYQLNEKLLANLKQDGVKFHCIKAGRENGSNWAVSVVKEKFYRQFSKLISLKGNPLATAVSRRNVALMQVIKKVNSADWVIGHNPGALWVTLAAGKRLNCKMGFDVEDYHPGEGHDKHLQGLTKNLMQQVMPKMDYVSFAAPLIMEEAKKVVEGSDNKWMTILNYFPRDEFILPQKNITGRLKLVWFSQNITAGRGLELLLPVVKADAARTELHLYGNVDNEFREKELLADNIFIHNPLSQKELHKELALYDVGLALEIPEDFNRDLCLTNKLLAYIQAGIYVLATNTTAQKSFLENFIQAGICFDIHINNVIVIFDSLAREIEGIRQLRMKRFHESEDFNWETASVSLVKAWGAVNKSF